MSAKLTREEALKLGATRYFGKPCVHGHGGERYAKTRGCVICQAIGNSKNSKIRKDYRVRLYNRSSTYVPEKPCRRGHMLRFTASNNCVECDKIAMNKCREVKQLSRIHKIYGLTEQGYASFKKKQKGKCAICHHKPKSIFNLHVDHCHKTTKVRGLLCGRCNQGLGLFRDDVKLLEKAKRYILCN